MVPDPKEYADDETVVPLIVIEVIALFHEGVGVNVTMKELSTVALLAGVKVGGVNVDELV